MVSAPSFIHVPYRHKQNKDKSFKKLNRTLSSCARWERMCAHACASTHTHMHTSAPPCCYHGKLCALTECVYALFSPSRCEWLGKNKLWSPSFSEKLHVPENSLLIHKPCSLLLLRRGSVNSMGIYFCLTPSSWTCILLCSRWKARSSDLGSSSSSLPDGEESYSDTSLHSL